MTSNTTISTSEVAFAAGVTEQDVCRLCDENALPPALQMLDESRRFMPLAAPFTAFYFRGDRDLSEATRARIILTLTERVLARRDSELFLSLCGRSRHVEFDWSVALGAATVSLSTFVRQASESLVRVRQAARCIKEDSAVLGGTPCFRHTRIPIANVLAAVKGGVTFEQLKAAYPFLTRALLKNAEVYASARPLKGAAPRLHELHPTAVLVRSKVVRTPRRPG